MQPAIHGGDPTGFYDEEVTSLFSQWRKDENLIHDFNFREKTLKVAMRAFDTLNLADWVSTQHSQGTVQFLHRRFLKEMLARALHGKAKTVENHQYYRLLTRAPSSGKIPDTGSPGEIDDSFIDAFKVDGRTGSAHLPTIIARWTEDLDGLCDLLATLNVIFGQRTFGVLHVAAA